MTEADIDAAMKDEREDYAKAADANVRDYFFLPTSDPFLVDWVAKDTAAAPPAISLDMKEHFFKYRNDIAAALQAANVPTYTINSDSVPTDLEATERYGVRVEFMSGVGHFVMLEDAETFNHLLENVVQRILSEAVE